LPAREPGTVRRGPVGAPWRDWTPIVLLVSTICLGTVAIVWAIERLKHPPPYQESEPGPERGERGAPADVDLWVGEVVPGVKGVLTSVFGDAQPDRAHDEELREGLRLAPGAPLAWYRLLLFNTSAEPRTVPLRPGGLVVETEDGATSLASLPALLKSGEARPSPALSAVLRGLGALREEVSLPAGDATLLLVCFDRRVDLAGAKTVATANGARFHRRRMGRGELQRLIAEPDSSQVSTL
jgi:hypothetical protein